MWPHYGAGITNDAQNAKGIRYIYYAHNSQFVNKIRIIQKHTHYFNM